MATERQANCKNCGEVFSYSLEWAEALAAEGRQPPEYCSRCRAIHALERRSVAMPYFVAKPTGPRKPDQELTAGRLGRLTHFERAHREVSVPAKFHQPDADIDFGIQDGDILELIEIMHQHQVTVVVGPTGSGKSTFLPYRLMVPPEPHPEDLFTRYGQIVITQPRIQATRGIPVFLARDLHGCTLGAGGDIGYVYSGERAADRRNKLIYCTDGTLINWIASGRIADFSIIIIDEAHERSLNIDVILGLLTKYLPLYPQLKLIIASATIDSDLFIEHFGVIGEVGFKDFKGLKRFSYETCHRKDKVGGNPRPDDMAVAVVDQTMQLLRNIATGERTSCDSPKVTEHAPEGDVLAFLPTVSSIEKAVSTLRVKIDADPLLKEREIQVYPLYTRLPIEKQDLALQKKTKAIITKVLHILRGILNGDSTDGNILALILDEKSVRETVKLISEIVDENPELLGTQILQWHSESMNNNLEDPFRRRVVVATYSDVSEEEYEQFGYVLHDRRVVISTNVAETSLTVDGIVYVVDSGLILQTQWNLDSLTMSYASGWHSQDGCKQRWGRSGRVRDGYAYCLYTKEQFEALDLHTLPEIRRAPLEQVVLTAKRAGVNDVENFPWVQPPNPKELARAIQALKDRGLIDREGDLTEHGQVVSKFRQEPNMGHLLALADRFACAIEVATFLAMRRLTPRGGLLEWNHKWDGHTRRAVRRIHDGLIVGCKDDLTLLLKVYQSWSEAWREEFNWLTDEPFEQIWSHKVPQPSPLMSEQLGEAQTKIILEKSRLARGKEELEDLVDPFLPDPMVESWLVEAIEAMRDCRCAAWARRFFVNHEMMVKARQARMEILEPLSIGKKEVETRALDFDVLLERTRLIMAYSWPDQVYRKNNGEYQSVSEKARVLEEDFEVHISDDSLLQQSKNQPDAIVCANRIAGRGHGRLGKRPLYVGLLAVLPPECINALKLPYLEFVQWVSNFLIDGSAEKPVQESTITLIDQRYPLGGVYSCRLQDESAGAERTLLVTKLVSPPPLVSETTPEGEIIWTEELTIDLGNDLDEEAGKQDEFEVLLDPEAENPLEGLEIEDTVLTDELIAQNQSASPIEAERQSSIPQDSEQIEAIRANLISESLGDDAQVIPARVAGYNLENLTQPELLMRYTPSPSVFVGFVSEHNIGDVIEVVAVEIESVSHDPQISLVVQIVDFELEVVMEATDLVFSGRYDALTAVEPGCRFEAIIRKIDQHNERIYLSCLPLLEEYLPSGGTKIQGVLSERAKNGVHINFDATPPDLPLPLSAYAAQEDAPQSIRHHGGQDRVTIIVDYEPEREKKLAGIDEKLQRLLGQSQWMGHVEWDSESNKLVVFGQLTNDERLILISKTDDPRVRRAINELYRLSNQLRARIDVGEILANYIQHVQIGSMVSGTVEKIWEKAYLLRLADGVRVKVSKSELRKQAIRKLKVGQTIEVILKSVDTEQGYATVELPTRLERINLQFPEGSEHEGWVTGVKPYGVFISLKDGFSGLLHESEIGYPTAEQIAEMYTVGDKVDVRILKIHNDAKIGLGLPTKTLEPQLQMYEIGYEYTGKVVRIFSDKVIVRLSAFITGQIDFKNISWCIIKHPSNVVKEGDEVKARMISVENNFVNLSLRLEGNDPKKKYPPGTVVEGEVIKILSAGALVELERGIVALIHKSELAWKKFEHPANVVGEGEKLLVKVLNVTTKVPRKLDLTLKRAFNIRLEIPTNKIGLLIGKKGRTINGIKEETDTEINVDDSGNVKIWGSSQIKVSDANKRIIELIPVAKIID